VMDVIPEVISARRQLARMRQAPGWGECHWTYGKDFASFSGAPLHQRPRLLCCGVVGTHVWSCAAAQLASRLRRPAANE